MVSHPATNPERGMALLMVILVLAALAAIGTPFVISMRLQEKGAARSVAQHRARLGALSARDHAVSSLFDTHHSRERENWQPGSTAPDLVDDIDEISINFPRSFSSDALGGEGPSTLQVRGSGELILDAHVEDEQGKINLNTAMPNLIGNLLAGSHLSESIAYDQEIDSLPLDDTSSFPVDDDPDTIDGVVVILNPVFFTVEAVSYTGKTEKALTGVFRGQYLSGTWSHVEGWPVFDLRGLKVFLHRLKNLSDGEIAAFRTPLGIRQIADWSVVPYFLQTLAVVGLSFDNMADWGLTPEMLVRAGIDPSILKKDDEEVDEAEYRKARKLFLDNNIPREVVDLVESVRGKAAVIEASVVLERLNIDLSKAQGNAFKGVYQTFIAPELKKIKNQSKKYFPGAVVAFQQIYDIPGMETFSAHNYEQIRQYITTSSTQPREWSQEQMVQGEITNSALLGVPQMRLPRYDFFNPGTVVRIRSISNPSKVEYGLAAGAFPTPRGGFRGMGRGGIFQGGVILKEPLKHEWAEREAMVSASLRHPVNINTAPRKVVEAVITGLSIERFGERFNAVTVKEAREVTNLLMEAMPIEGYEAFRVIVESAQSGGHLDGQDTSAILLNALNPNHPRLSISTTGFCFATSDIYTVESKGVFRNPAGYPEATVRLREIIEVAPPDPLFLRLETQADWASLYSTRNVGRGPFSRFNSTFVPGRASNLMISGPVPLNRRRFTGPSLDEGTLRGTTISNEMVTGNYGFGSLGLFEVEHFSETIEGHELEDGPWKRSVLIRDEPEQGGRNGQDGVRIVVGPGGVVVNPPGASPGFDPTGAAVAGQLETPEALTTIPAMIDFWYRPRWGSRSGNKIIFDSIGATNEPYRDRTRLYFDGETQELVLQVIDDTGSALAWSNNVLPAAEVRYQVTPTTFADDTWYHITAGWRSTRPGDLVLLIDRRPVGRQSWLTRLAGGCSMTSNRVRVEDEDMAARFPPTGTLLVGAEAIDYVGKEGAAFIVRPPGPNGQPPIGRGARGTVRNQHARGTPVRLLGYSLPLANSDERLGVEDSGNRIIIGPGGASLALEMPPTMQIRSFNASNGAIELGPATYARASTDAGFTAPGLISTLELEPFGASSISLLVQTQGSHPFELGFPAHGYIKIRQYTRNATGVMQHVASEFAKYSSITPGPVPGLYRFTGMGRALLNSQVTDGTSANPGDTRLLVFGVSIEADATNLDQLYAPSGVVQIDRPPGVLPGGVLLDVEWIRYTQLAEGKYFICDPDLADAFRGYTGNRYVNSSDPFRQNRPRWDENGVVLHLAGQELVQVVRTVGAGAGYMDEVILGDGYGDPTARLRETLPLRVRKVREADTGVYLSFLFPPEGTYLPVQDPRIRKFPSGGLPATSGGDLIFGTPAIVGNGIDAPGTIDEIRFSRIDGVDVDTFAFPVRPNGSYIKDSLPGSSSVPAGTRAEVLRSSYGASDSEQPGGGLDRLRLLARSRLIPAATGEGFARSFARADPRAFGMGKTEGLLLIDEEAMHYSFDPGQVDQDIVIQLTQDLPRDPFLNEDALADGVILPYDPARDLRTEVVNIVKVNSTQQLPPNGGFLEIISGSNREILFYEQASNGVLRNVLRGQLGTPVGGYVFQWSYIDASGQTQVVTNTIRMRLLPFRDIDILTRGMLGTERLSNSLGYNALLPIPAIPIVRLAGAITEISLSTLGNPAGFPRGEGYLLLDDGNPATLDEIVAHTGPEGAAFGLFRDDRSGRGIFHGRFGTQFRQPGVNTPAIELVPRHHDRYQPLVESKDLQYLERAWTMPGTMWDRIGWEVEEARNRRTMGTVRVLARFDGYPGWDSEPTNQPGGLYQFDDPDALNQIDRLSDALEIRIYYRHRPGAYGPLGNGFWNDEWKHLPVLRNLSVEHRKEWRVLRHEEIPY